MLRKPYGLAWAALGLAALACSLSPTIATPTASPSPSPLTPTETTTVSPPTVTPLPSGSGPCLTNSSGEVTIYTRPSLLADIFSTVGLPPDKEITSRSAGVVFPCPVRPALRLTSRNFPI